MFSCNSTNSNTFGYVFWCETICFSKHLCYGIKIMVCTFFSIGYSFLNINKRISRSCEKVYLLWKLEWNHTRCTKNCAMFLHFWHKTLYLGHLWVSMFQVPSPKRPGAALTIIEGFLHNYYNDVTHLVHIFLNSNSKKMFQIHWIDAKSRVMTARWQSPNSHA